MLIFRNLHSIFDKNPLPWTSYIGPLIYIGILKPNHFNIPSMDRFTIMHNPYQRFSCWMLFSSSLLNFCLYKRYWNSNDLPLDFLSVVCFKYICRKFKYKKLRKGQILEHGKEILLVRCWIQFQGEGKRMRGLWGLKKNTLARMINKFWLS